MTRSATIRVTVTEQNDWVDAFSQGNLSEAQKNLLRFVAKEAVAEYIRETSLTHVKQEDMILDSAVPETGFFRLSQVLEVIPVGKTCWWEGIRTGRFPKPVKLSARCTAWRVEDIRALIKDIGNKVPR